MKEGNGKTPGHFGFCPPKVANLCRDQPPSAFVCAPVVVGYHERQGIAVAGVPCRLE
jgi:hypothetical protein